MLLELRKYRHIFNGPVGERIFRERTEDTSLSKQRGLNLTRGAVKHISRITRIRPLTAYTDLCSRCFFSVHTTTAWLAHTSSVSINNFIASIKIPNYKMVSACVDKRRVLGGPVSPPDSGAGDVGVEIIPTPVPKFKRKRSQTPEKESKRPRTDEYAIGPEVNDEVPASPENQLSSLSEPPQFGLMQVKIKREFKTAHHVTDQARALLQKFKRSKYFKTVSEPPVTEFSYLKSNLLELPYLYQTNRPFVEPRSNILRFATLTTIIDDIVVDVLLSKKVSGTAIKAGSLIGFVYGVITHIEPGHNKWVALTSCSKRQVYLDLDTTESTTMKFHSNWAKYLSHQPCIREPTTLVLGVVYLEGLAVPEVAVWTRRDIAAGEQLGLDWNLYQDW